MHHLSDGSPDGRRAEPTSEPRSRITIVPEILHGGTAEVMLPTPLTGYSWRIEWRLIGQEDWHVAERGLGGGPHGVSDANTPEPQHRIEWQAVAEPGEPVPRCTICGARPATSQRYGDPECGPVALCEEHRGRELDWA